MNSVFRDLIGFYFKRTFIKLRSYVKVIMNFNYDSYEHNFCTA